jgi:hypothetical protein
MQRKMERAMGIEYIAQMRKAFSNQGVINDRECCA